MNVRMQGQVKLLTVDEVSEITRVPKSTLQNWAAYADRGAIAYGPPHVQLSPRKRVWVLEDVLAWIEEKRGR